MGINTFRGLNSHSLSMNILNTQSPIVEDFLNAWMEETVMTDFSDDNEDSYPLPKVDMCIKYWDSQRIENFASEKTEPNFIYFFTGLWPNKFDSWKPTQMTSGDGSLQRPCVFSFNELIILRNKTDAQRYGLAHLFNSEYTSYQYFDRRTTC